MVSAAHVFGTVSITTERKLPPKTLNLNRRHMAYEGPPRKKLKSINPLYPQTPLECPQCPESFSRWESEKFSAVHATHFLQLSNGFPEHLENIPDVCFDNLFMKGETNTRTMQYLSLLMQSIVRYLQQANVRTFCSMSSAVW